jgi:hypothetical protein
MDGPASAGGGRRALFSPPAEGQAPVAGRAVVECRTCLARSTVPLAALAFRLVPSLWVPARYWSRLMRCPSCGRVSWCHLDWRGLLS